MSHDLVQERARLTLLHEADLEVEGLLHEASNVTVRAWLDAPESADAAAALDADTVAGGSAARPRVVYKPVRGTAQLRDFDATTLAAREVAAYRISRAGGWHLVPPTVLRDGPLGVGSVQWWIEDALDDASPGGRLLDVVGPADLPDGWLPVVAAQDDEGRPLVVAHADRADLASLAVLDTVLNNADRKGGHVTLDAEGRMWAFDHGLTLHVEDKLRTVLWGWAGEPLRPADRTRLLAVAAQLHPGQRLAEDLDGLVGAAELAMLAHRVAALLDDGCYPDPPPGRYPLPWPIW